MSIPERLDSNQLSPDSGQFRVLASLPLTVHTLLIRDQWSTKLECQGASSYSQFLVRS